MKVVAVVLLMMMVVVEVVVVVVVFVVVVVIIIIIIIIHNSCDDNRSRNSTRMIPLIFYLHTVGFGKVQEQHAISPRTRANRFPWSVRLRFFGSTESPCARRRVPMRLDVVLASFFFPLACLLACYLDD